MPRYIDVDVVIAKCKAIINDKWNEQAAPVSWADAYANFVDDIENVPTADVEPVRHGRWIEKDSRYVHNFKCSVCNDVRFDIPTCMGKPLFNFCPNCGAKMNKEVKDNV